MWLTRIATAQKVCRRLRGTAAGAEHVGRAVHALRQQDLDAIGAFDGAACRALAAKCYDPERYCAVVLYPGGTA